MGTLTAIGALEEHFKTTYGVPEKPEERPAGRWFHLWMVGVAQESRGKGIARKLAVHSVGVAKARGFAIAFAECTGAASTQVLTSHCNAAVEHFVDYSTFDGCESAAVLRELPQKGHKGMSLTIVHLK